MMKLSTSSSYDFGVLDLQIFKNSYLILFNSIAESYFLFAILAFEFKYYNYVPVCIT